MMFMMQKLSLVGLSQEGGRYMNECEKLKKERDELNAKLEKSYIRIMELEEKMELARDETEAVIDGLTTERLLLKHELGKKGDAISLMRTIIDRRTKMRDELRGVLKALDETSYDDGHVIVMNAPYELSDKIDTLLGKGG